MRRVWHHPCTPAALTPSSLVWNMLVSSSMTGGRGIPVPAPDGLSVLGCSRWVSTVLETAKRRRSVFSVCLVQLINVAPDAPAHSHRAMQQCDPLPPRWHMCIIARPGRRHDSEVVIYGIVVPRCNIPYRCTSYNVLYDVSTTLSKHIAYLAIQHESLNIRLASPNHCTCHSA